MLSLALDRKIMIPIDQAIPIMDKVHFLPVSQVVDQNIVGPMPTDIKDRLTTFITAVAGLPDEHQEHIGVAVSAYYGALLMFDREPRAAYTQLIAGIETLSRKYGNPPSDWNDWDDSKKWEASFADQGLTESQKGVFRAKLMDDKQLRLGETFRNYACSRINDDFWQKTLEHWVYGTDETGQRLPAVNMRSRTVSDVLPHDRESLKNLLKNSYNLRSGVVHQANWVDLMTLVPFPSQSVGIKRPLPFPLLRMMLAELIWLEISEHSMPTQLPDFRLLRTLEAK